MDALLIHSPAGQHISINSIAGQQLFISASHLTRRKFGPPLHICKYRGPDRYQCKRVLERLSARAPPEFTALHWDQLPRQWGRTPWGMACKARSDPERATRSSATGLEQVQEIEVSPRVCKTPTKHPKVFYTHLEAFKQNLHTTGTSRRLLLSLAGYPAPRLRLPSGLLFCGASPKVTANRAAVNSARDLEWTEACLTGWQSNQLVPKTKRMSTYTFMSARKRLCQIKRKPTPRQDTPTT